LRDEYVAKWSEHFVKGLQSLGGTQRA
jgi:hypothetical protein